MGISKKSSWVLFVVVLFAVFWFVFFFFLLCKCPYLEVHWVHAVILRAPTLWV